MFYLKYLGAVDGLYTLFTIYHFICLSIITYYYNFIAF